MIYCKPRLQPPYGWKQKESTTPLFLNDKDEEVMQSVVTPCSDCPLQRLITVLMGNTAVNRTSRAQTTHVCADAEKHTHFDQIAKHVRVSLGLFIINI